jgi:hypothetical protein
MKEPRASIKVGRKFIQVRGRVITDPGEVADFLEQRFANRPMFITVLFWLQGYRGKLTRDVFERYAQNRVMVQLKPL